MKLKQEEYLKKLKEDKFWKKITEESLGKAWNKGDKIWDYIYNKQKKIDNKGQLLDRPFIFIFSVVVSGLIFIFGFYLITNLMKTNECGQLGLFVNDLRNSVNRYYSFDTGSSTDINLKLPQNIKHICFYTKEEYIDRSEFDKIDKNLFDAFNNLDYNVIFLPLNICEKSFFNIENLKPKENPTCVLNKGTVNLFLENKGDYVEIRT